MTSISKVTKGMVYKLLYDLGLISTPVLDKHFKSVWIGPSTKNEMDRSKRRLEKGGSSIAN